MVRYRIRYSYSEYARVIQCHKGLLYYSLLLSFCSFFLRSLFSHLLFPVVSTTASNTPCVPLSGVEGAHTWSAKHMSFGVSQTWVEFSAFLNCHQACDSTSLDLRFFSL